MGASKDRNSSSSAELRRQAEKRLQKKKEQQPSRSNETDRRLLHELEVHQIELEMQNAELRKTQEELTLSRDNYTELYDFAPIGYVTIDGRNVIREINLMGAKMLGADRGALINRPFVRFIADRASIELFEKHREELHRKQDVQTCAIKLKRSDGVIFHAQIQSTIRKDTGAETKAMFTTILDVSDRKLFEDTLQNAHDVLDAKVHERTIQLHGAYEEIKAMKEELEAENIYFRQERSMQYHDQNKTIIGQSDSLKYTLYRAEKVAFADTTVLILGETGTGKGLVAFSIHEMSPRKHRPLITVNCAALPTNLLESELFGREKGAFTGADTRRIGRFEIAKDSTICLDEIGELPLELQAKLLRVIQYHEFERLGSSQTIKVDVRVIATTNRNLEEAVSKGRFREDLYYRLNVFPITVPPLRQRKDDIPKLVEVFVERYSKKIGKKITSISKEALRTLQHYSWPGNIRELESIIERAVIMCPGPTLYLEDKLPTLSLSASPPSPTGRTLEETERAHILHILSETRGRIEGEGGAAAILAIHPSTLRARMQKLGIARPDSRKMS